MEIGKVEVSGGITVSLEITGEFIARAKGITIRSKKVRINEGPKRPTYLEFLEEGMENPKVMGSVMVPGRGTIDELMELIALAEKLEARRHGGSA